MSRALPPASSRAPRRRAAPWTTWAIAAAGIVLVVAAAVALWGRIVRVQEGAVVPQVPQGVTHDPATRARGAVVSISGEGSHPIATYDPPSGTVTVRFQSRYYNPRHTAKLNRQYLATEGRLVVQLILYDDPEVSRAVVDLYHGRQELATVSGTPQDSYAGYTVTYARGLP
jgi:hypothetical protein